MIHKTGEGAEVGDAGKPRDQPVVFDGHAQEMSNRRDRFDPGLARWRLGRTESAPTVRPRARIGTKMAETESLLSGRSQ